MLQNIIPRITKAISNDFNLLDKENELIEIEFSINELKIIIDNEKIRENQIKHELKSNKNSNNNALLEYLKSIEKNIKTLSSFLEILYKKKNLLNFDIKSCFDSIEEKIFEESIK